jgi:hypothetical protein
VLLFEGRQASGKTSLLNELAAGYDRTLPHAVVDLRAFEDRLGSSAVPQLLADMAFQLAEYCNRYGTLRFPRFVLGQVIMTIALDGTDRQRARRQVRKALRSHRGVAAVTAFLGQAAEGALAPTPVRVSPGTLGMLFDAVMDRLAPWRPLRRYILGPYQQWYGDPDGRLGGMSSKERSRRSIEMLINLNRWAGTGNVQDQKKINRLLWKAFLADLRDNFEHGRHCREWPYGSVVLLDNADTDLGKEFLGGLARTGWRGRVDPLTIVATSDRGLAVQLGVTNQPLIYDAGRSTADDAPWPAWASWVRLELSDPPPREGGALAWPGDPTAEDE